MVRFPIVSNIFFTYFPYRAWPIATMCLLFVACCPAKQQIHKLVAITKGVIIMFETKVYKIFRLIIIAIDIFRENKSSRAYNEKFVWVSFSSRQVNRPTYYYRVVKIQVRLSWMWVIVVFPLMPISDTFTFLSLETVHF